MKKSIINIICLNSTGTSKAAIEGLFESVQIINSLDLIKVNLNLVADDELDNYLSNSVNTCSERQVVMIPPFTADHINSFDDIHEWLSQIDTNLFQAINRASEQNALITAACAGVILLCRGLLSPPAKVATHASFYAMFKDQFSSIYLEENKAIVKDGNIITSGGYFGWKYLLISILQEFIDKNQVNYIAGILNIELEFIDIRTCTNIFVYFHPTLISTESRIAKIQQFIHDKQGVILSKAKIAADFGFHPKTLDRYFRKFWSISLNNYCLKIKIQAMCTQLIETDLPFSSIAYTLGYKNVNSANMLFKKHLKLTPLEFRRKHSVLNIM
ncbi:helix-turn-helix domain-containing protein [Thorsellia kenyensis]|uniref:Helix-turn-helix domain-containing protein n=1 Tax=Thorsellia kenyensis TaxID=1549888 RepID=A0ABV6CGG6_9GAMM